MKIVLAVIGWLLTIAGVVMFLLIVVDGVHRRDNALLITPTSTLIVAGAIFVLASVLVSRQPLTPPAVQNVGYHQGPSAPQFHGGPN